MKKRGDIDPAPNALIGIILGVLILVTFVGCGLKIWDIYLQSQTDIGSFDDLVEEINGLEVPGETIFSHHIGKAFVLIAFDKGEAGKRIGTSVQGTATPPMEALTTVVETYERPDTCKEDNEMPACLCVCENPYTMVRKDLCASDRDKCVTFSDVDEFELGSIRGDVQEDFSLDIKKEKVDGKVKVILVVK